MRKKKVLKADAAASFLRVKLAPAPQPDASPGVSFLIRLLAHSPFLTALILWSRRRYWPAWFEARLSREICPSRSEHRSDTRHSATLPRAPRR